jgi:hypothetical protein
LDYTARRNNFDYRIGKGEEIVKSIDHVYTKLRNLNVSCNLQIGGNFRLKTFEVTEITNNYTRSSSNASSSNLITEYGSKAYLDQYLSDTMVLQNLVVRDTTVAMSNATMCNKLTHFCEYT